MIQPDRALVVMYTTCAMFKYCNANFFSEDFFKKPDFFNVLCKQMIEKENQLYISEFVNVQYIYIPLSVTR